MKIVTLLLSLVISFSVFKANSQSKFYLATEGNFIYDLYQVTDEGTAIGPPNIRTLDVPGITFLAGYELTQIFSVEAGIATRPVKGGFSIETGSVKSQSESSGTYYQIPVRTRARIPIFGDWLFANASLGMQLSVTDPTRVGLTFTSEGGGSGSGGNDVYSYTTQYIALDKFFITAAVAAGLDFKINPKFNIYSTFTYNRGFTDLRRTDIQYQFQNEPQRTASVLHQGSYLSVNIGLRVHLNARE